MGNLKDADDPVFDIAVGVEADLALQRLDVRVLDCVAHRGAGDLLARGRDPLDRVENDERRIVGRDRVIVGLLAIFFDKMFDERRRIGVFEHIRRGDRRIPTLRRRKAGTFEDFRPIDAVAPGLDHIGDDVVGLLDQLDPGLRHAAIVDGIGVQLLDLGQGGRVVGFLRVELIVAEHVDAALFGLRLEGVGQPDAVCAAVVEHVDRFHL